MNCRLQLELLPQSRAAISNNSKFSNYAAYDEGADEFNVPEGDPVAEVDPKAKDREIRTTTRDRAYHSGFHVALMGRDILELGAFQDPERSCFLCHQIATPFIICLNCPLQPYLCTECDASLHTGDHALLHVRQVVLTSSRGVPSRLRLDCASSLKVQDDGVIINTDRPPMPTPACAKCLRPMTRGGPIPQMGKTDSHLVKLVTISGVVTTRPHFFKCACLHDSVDPTKLCPITMFLSPPSHVLPPHDVTSSVAFLPPGFEPGITG